MMNFSERRIHSAKILFATRYSLFAAVSRLADLPISFGSAGASPSHDVAD
jgi:hypothetical protein